MVTDRARPAAGAQPQPPSAGIVEDNRVRRAMLLIEQNLSTPQRVEKIAQTVGLSKRQLERVFRKLVGKSVQEYSRDLRVLYGRWLLANSPQTITEVATECGFSDVSHFNRLFRRSFGCSPSTMRRSENQEFKETLEEWDNLRTMAGSPAHHGEFNRYLSDEPVRVPGIDKFLCRERRPYAQ